jgi:hypothetical protein
MERRCIWIWAAIEPLLPSVPPWLKGGRSRAPWQAGPPSGQAACRQGYDYRRCRRECRARGVARRGIDSGEKPGRYRWMIERSLAWLACFRRLEVRHGRRADVYLAFTTPACATVCIRQIRRVCP